MAPASTIAEATAGIVASLHRLHGHTRRTDTETPADGNLEIAAVVDRAALQDGCAARGRRPRVASRLSRPMAGCQVVPLSAETSTPATTPPPPSAAVPLITTAVPDSSSDPAAGDMIVELGRVVSVEAVAGDQARLRRRRLHAHVGEQVHRRLPHVVQRCWNAANRVARHRRRSAAVVVVSRPQGHCTVPAPKTSAPLACRYKVRLWVAVPGPIRRAVVQQVLGADVERSSRRAA